MDDASRLILRNRLLLEEGVRLAAYYDQFGYPTQGVGRLLSTSINEDLSRYPDIDMNTCNTWLDQDINTAYQHMLNSIDWTSSLDNARQTVLVDMIFQMGIGGLLKFVNMLASCQSGDYNMAAQEMLNSKWASQTPKRARNLASIMLRGQYGDQVV